MTDETPFGTALHDRVRDEHPDLDELVRSSTATGLRIRRRRQVGAVVLAAAGVTAVAVGVGALQGPDGTTSDGVPIANQPTSAPPTANVNEAGELSRLAELSQDTSREDQLMKTPVHVTADGWGCTEPADEKYICTRQGAGVTVSWRPAADHQAYLDPGKADVMDDVHTFVSDVRGRWFATVAPAEGTTQAEVDEVGASLMWTPELPPGD